ncbi:hypothetical protein G210_4214 [Candida maltosa Xu316]|uniref:LicD/FKTN/FKRP nucleotidyltransferase domain-containing protein n=1 Tax=Candida maltosa (strain Xu316) TaxID=1245528 RepID=M3IH39_CANMX|nr:hypothetical protein G210_4214 [Candida maltosa Xu316]
MAVSFIKTTHMQLTTPLNQIKLQSEALQYHKENNFNPKKSLLNILHFLHNWDTDAIATGGDSEYGVYFHWDDWMPLPTNKLDHARLNNGVCDDQLIQFSSVSAHWLESLAAKKLRGMCHMFCQFPIPEKLILTTDSKFIEIPVVEKKRLNIQNNKNDDINDNNNDDDDDAVTTRDLIASMTTLNLHKSQFPYRDIPKLPHKLEIDPEDFKFNPREEITKLEYKLGNGTIDRQEYKHLKSLQYSNSIVDTTDRYFKYAWIFTDVYQGNSHHVAYPFFQRYISDRERQAVLHHMVRVWFQLMEAYGFQTWINYGSMLGWKFNGLNMPWDTDIDVQIPIAQLDKLAQVLNKTLVVENPRYGNARYWLEVSPTFVRQGNGKNHIDARFIDINSGLYIDISALSFEEQQQEEEEPLLRCKNYNYFSYDEISPIQSSFFEGASVYLPNNITGILNRKYPGALTDYTFKDFEFTNDMWVSQTNQDPNYLQDEYLIAKDSIARHKYLEQFGYDKVEEMEELPIYRKDPWDYYEDLINHGLDNDRWYIRKEIV